MHEFVCVCVWWPILLVQNKEQKIAATIPAIEVRVRIDVKIYREFWEKDSTDKTAKWHKKRTAITPTKCVESER